MLQLAKQIFAVVEKEGYGELPNDLKHRLKDFKQQYYAKQMLKNKAALRQAEAQAKLPKYLSFYKEDKTEPLEKVLQAYKTGEYNIKEEGEELNTILKFLENGKQDKAYAMIKTLGLYGRKLKVVENKASQSPQQSK